MQASELIRRATEIIAGQSSPWKAGLLRELEQIEAAVNLHEDVMNEVPSPPRTTALGHTTSGHVVAGSHTATDEALAVLDCVD